MSRSLLILLFVAGVVGCQGQSNPFMRTTVPPPATGAGAPTDPYYNNSGRSQPPVTSATAAPAPVQATPAVPPPDKRFTQPGGFNFPQGSILHRKAVDPTPDGYRTGTTMIARAARPRSTLGGNHASGAAVAVATNESTTSELTPESAPAVMQASAEEVSTEAPLTVAAAQVEPVTDDRADDAAIESEQKLAASVDPEQNATPEAAPAEVTLHATTAEQGAGTLRIVSADNDSSDSISESLPNDARSPFVTVSKPTTSLTVAPPAADATAPSEATIARTAGETASDAGSRTRFYFDRNQNLYPAKAQPVTYLDDKRGNVDFAGGAAANGGVNGGPDGAAAYAYQTEYQWLRGKLEYSSAANRWKLRYIPIDGVTDQYGGSVVLPASPLLEKMQAGEMVTARGTIGTAPAEHGRFAPLYNLSALERQ